MCNWWSATTLHALICNRWPRFGSRFMKQYIERRYWACTASTGSGGRHELPSRLSKASLKKLNSSSSHCRLTLCQKTEPHMWAIWTSDGWTNWLDKSPSLIASTLASEKENPNWSRWVKKIVELCNNSWVLSCVAGARANTDYWTTEFRGLKIRCWNTRVEPVKNVLIESVGERRLWSFANSADVEMPWVSELHSLWVRVADEGIHCPSAS